MSRPGTWQKGKSGNPGGLTKERRALLADAHTAALDVLLAKGATGDKTKDQELWEWGLNHPDAEIRVKVWFRAQDYAFGSPAHVLEVTANGAALNLFIEPARPQTAEEWLVAHGEAQKAIADSDQGIQAAN